ncbi:MAG TPA: MBL fold metallo-hydrolase [Acidobacteriaceae bacterium]|jgi:glyoxylase-like metal-dependent hydrolase (beta-lactamase superfamily II)|nr:MBL fold metallo-hydrolase [Acidobacteriaceae bacterium]
MTVHTVSTYGHQFTRFGLFNCYLVRESDSCTLLDTGLPGSAPRIVRAARAIGTEPIARVLLTHAHGDHIGSLDALAPMLGRAEVAIGRREARLMPKPPAQDRSLDPDEPQCRVKGSFPGAKTAPTHLFGDHSSSGSGELYGSLRAVATPGHTPGHMSYFDERDGTLYAGDALVTVGGRVHVPGFGPWYFPLPGMATWHRPTALASARRLLSLPIRRYAAGHGRLVEGGPELLERAIRRADLSLQKGQR